MSHQREQSVGASPVQIWPSVVTGAGMHAQPSRLLTLDEVAAYVGVPKRWLYEQARTGALPAILIARTYRFRLSDVDVFLDGFRVTPGPGSS